MRNEQGQTDHDYEVLLVGILAVIGILKSCLITDSSSYPNLDESFKKSEKPRTGPSRRTAVEQAAVAEEEGEEEEITPPSPICSSSSSTQELAKEDRTAIVASGEEKRDLL